MKIKNSKKKMFICGDYAELITYEKPYYYNHAPIEKKSFFRSTEKKVRSDSSVNRARQNLYKLILSNIDEKQKYKNLFLTLTFKKNVTNIKEANYEFKKFIQRFNYIQKAHCKYIGVIEFQKRGAIHYHVLFFNVPYIEDIRNKIRVTWRNGFIKINAIKEIKNISAYVSKYIQKGFFDKRHFGEKVYISSRNLKRPERIRKQERVDKYMDENILKLESTHAYSSGRYGLVIYKKFKIKK